MKINKEDKEKMDLKQVYDLMLHEDLVERLLEAHLLLKSALYILITEHYVSLPDEINKFLDVI